MASSQNIFSMCIVNIKARATLIMCQFFKWATPFLGGINARTLMNDHMMSKVFTQSSIEIFGAIISMQNLNLGMELSFDHEVKIDKHRTNINSIL